MKYLNIVINQKFIAHNGNTFDHRIMINQRLFNNVYKNQLLDSKNIIRLMINTDNLQLKSLYLKIVPDPDIEGYHRAEADVEMLIAILKMLDF